MLGGLNYQIEHHLFPRVPHTHYPQIAEIVRRNCASCTAYATWRSIRCAQPFGHTSGTCGRWAGWAYPIALEMG